MLTKATVRTLATGSAAIFIFNLGLLFSQQPPAPPTSVVSEFPVLMRQKVTAGKTPAGTKVQAELVIATMVNGVVVPRSAVLSGEVTESVAKSKTDPSRLAIRMDSVEWKGGSTPVKAYLTSWYYPEMATMNQNLSFEPPDQANGKGNWNGQGAYPDPNSHIAQDDKFPGRGSDKDPSAGAPPSASTISKRRTLMKNIGVTRSSDGAVALTSDHTTIKLDRLTTYVLADGDLTPTK
jgi:hypothetical protein